MIFVQIGNYLILIKVSLFMLNILFRCTGWVPSIFLPRYLFWKTVQGFTTTCLWCHMASQCCEDEQVSENYPPKDPNFLPWIWTTPAQNLQNLSKQYLPNSIFQSFLKSRRSSRVNIYLVVLLSAIWTESEVSAPKITNLKRALCHRLITASWYSRKSSCAIQFFWCLVLLLFFPIASHIINMCLWVGQIRSKR